MELPPIEAGTSSKCMPDGVCDDEEGKVVENGVAPSTKLCNNSASTHT